MQWMQQAPAWFAASRAEPLPLFAARLQNQMYFGLLSAVLCETVDRDSFLEPDGDDGGKVIDSVKIEKRLQKWQKSPHTQPSTTQYFHSLEMKEVCEMCTRAREISNKYGTESASAREDYTTASKHCNRIRYDECHKVLRQTWDIINTHLVDCLLASDTDTDADLWTAPTYAVLFSIDILLDLLETYLDVEPSNSVHATAARDLRRCHLVTIFPPFRNSICRSGRCPSLAWCHQLSATEYYRLLFLPNHSYPLDHRSCTIQKCNRFNATVTTQHQGDCQGCEYIESELQVVLKYISEDSIPLVHLQEDAQGQVRIKIVKGNLLSNFTAISHVWTGGLGNDTRNALPQCQLQYLLRVVTELPRPPPTSFGKLSKVLFGEIESLEFRDPAEVLSASLGWRRRRQALVWIDSLCIPNNALYSSIADEHREEINNAKARAISSMAQLYAGAEKVLVLDPELRDLPSEVVHNNRSILALYIRICPWMARSWPLQEGALAQNLYFQLKDRAILLEESLYTRIGLPSLRMIDHYSEHKAEDGTESRSRFTHIWNSLVSRSTTQAKDVSAILAAMLDCSAEEVLGLPQEQRMRALLKAQESLPIALFYQPNSLSDNQWTPNIPGSDPRQTFIHHHYGTLRATPKGAVLENVRDTIAILIDGVPEGKNFTLMLDDPGNRACYAVNQDSTSNEQSRENPLAQTVFLLSKFCAVGGSRYHGARFSVLDRNTEALTMKFENETLWVPISLDDVAMVSIPGYHYTDCKLLYNPEKPDLEVLVDISVDGTLWPTLTWSRNVALSLPKLVDTDILQTIAATCLTVSTLTIAFFIYTICLESLEWKQLMQSYPWRTRLSLILAASVIGLTRTIIALLQFPVIWCRFTRSVQTLWAASFYDTTALSRRLLSFDMGLFAPHHLSPLSFTGIVTGAALCLGWTRFGASWMLFTGIGCVLDLPVYLLWLVLVQRARLDVDKVSNWFYSVTAWQVLVRITAFLMLLVFPAMGAAWWALWEDPFVALLWALFSLTYFPWLYLDLRRGLSISLVRHENGPAFALMAVALYFLYLGTVRVIIGLRYCSSYSALGGIGCLCAISGFFGFLLGKE